MLSDIASLPVLPAPRDRDKLRLILVATLVELQPRKVYAVDVQGYWVGQRNVPTTSSKVIDIDANLDGV